MRRFRAYNACCAQGSDGYPSETSDAFRTGRLEAAHLTLGIVHESTKTVDPPPLAFTAEAHDVNSRSRRLPSIQGGAWHTPAFCRLLPPVALRRQDRLSVWEIWSAYNGFSRCLELGLGAEA